MSRWVAAQRRMERRPSGRTSFRDVRRRGSWNGAFLNSREGKRIHSPTARTVAGWGEKKHPSPPLPPPNFDAFKYAQQVEVDGERGGPGLWEKAAGWLPICCGAEPPHPFLGGVLLPFLGRNSH